MSEMFPPSISIPGSPEGPAEAEAPPSGGSQAAAVAAIRKAKAQVGAAIQNEADHADVLILEKANTLLQQYLTANQSLVDQATGAGSGERLIRKVMGG